MVGGGGGGGLRGMARRCAVRGGPHVGLRYTWAAARKKPLPAGPVSRLQPPSPTPQRAQQSVPRAVAASGGGKTARRTVLEVEEEEEELALAPAPTRSRGRSGRALAAGRPEAEPLREELESGADSEDEGSQQQGSMLGSMLRSVQKTLSRGRRPEAEDEGGDHLGE